MMVDVIIAFVISVAAAIGVISVCARIQNAERKRVLARIVALSCPACSQTFGSDVLSTLREAGYLWNCAPGNSVSSLQLPGHTFQVTCPNCSAETEFKESGEIFQKPRDRLLGFTKAVLD